MKPKPIKFNADKLRQLIIDRHGSIESFVASLGDSGFQITRAGVHLWLVGRVPRAEALYAVASHFNEPMENFLVACKPHNVGLISRGQ